MIEIKNADIVVNKDKVLFENLNLEFKTNEITGLIAPSGTGKTSIFNAMLGLLEVKNGDILYDGQAITNKKFYQDVSFMPQEEGLYLSLTGKQNLKFFASLKNITLSDNEIKQLFDEYALTNNEDKQVANYSGGMKKKLGLMIAFLGESKYIFLDEPTVGIDPVQKEEFWNRIKKANQQPGKTIVVTTHVMEEATRCDSLIFLRDGKVLVADLQANILSKLGVDDLNEAFINLTKGEL